MSPYNNKDEQAEVNFTMNGPAFKDGIPIHYLLSGLGELHSIVDKTFLGLVKDKKRLTKEDRQHFQLRTKGVYHGSLDTSVAIVLAGYQIAMPFISELGPKAIWEYTKSTYAFLKFIFAGLRKGDKPTYNFSDNINSTFTVNNGSITQTFNAPVYYIGQQALEHYQNLNSLLDTKTVDKIDIGSKSNPEINLTLPERDLFFLPSQIDQNPISLQCEIFDFNKYNNSGKLQVFPEQEVPHGEYRFQVIGNQAIVPFIEAMLRTRVTVKCLKETSADPFGKGKVYRLQVIDIDLGKAA